MEKLEQTINQAIADFDSIKEVMEQNGVSVPYGTDTKDYAGLLNSILENSGDLIDIAEVHRLIDESGVIEYDAS